VDGDGKLKEQADELHALISPPSSRQLFYVFLAGGIPMIGFGFLDNSVMLLAGEAIDHHLGVLLGLSTLAAAALGNMISDLLGYSFGGTLEAAAIRFGLFNPELTRAQSRMSATKRTHSIAGAVGLTLGCILGMFPLLFFDETDKSPKLKQLFQALDSKHSGRVSKAEIFAGAQKYGLSISEATVSRLVDSVDADHDGLINFDEFSHLITTQINSVVTDFGGIQGETQLKKNLV